MPAGNMRTPSDTGYTGKYVRTFDKGGTVGHEQYFRRAYGPSYRVWTGEVTLATAISRNAIVTLWHPATQTTSVYIQKIMLHMRVGHTAGNLHIKTQFISGENATPGGTVINPQQLNRGNPNSGLTIRQSPAVPTRVGNLIDDYTKMAAALSGGADDSSYSLYRADEAESIELRAGQAEGVEISADIIAALTGAPILVIGVEYTEETP